MGKVSPKPWASSHPKFSSDPPNPKPSTLNSKPQTPMRLRGLGKDALADIWDTLLRFAEEPGNDDEGFRTSAVTVRVEGIGYRV